MGQIQLGPLVNSAGLFGIESDCVRSALPLTVQPQCCQDISRYIFFISDLLLVRALVWCCACLRRCLVLLVVARFKESFRVRFAASFAMAAAHLDGVRARLGPSSSVLQVCMELVVRLSRWRCFRNSLWIRSLA